MNTKYARSNMALTTSRMFKRMRYSPSNTTRELGHTYRIIKVLG